jgi:hypothetical protein
MAILTDSNALYVLLGGNDGFPHHRYFFQFWCHISPCFIPFNSVLQKLLSLIGLMFQMQGTGFHVTRFMTIRKEL